MRRRKKTGVFTRVRNLETEQEGTVVDNLSAQITVEYDDGTFGFLMKKWMGSEWKPINKENNNDSHHRKQ